MNKEQISTLVLSSLNLVLDPDTAAHVSPIVGININETECTALVKFDSVEISQKCLDLGEIGYFGKVIGVSPGTEFNIPNQTATTIPCEYNFPSIAAFIDALFKNRNLFMDLQRDSTFENSPIVTINLEGPSQTKVAEVSNTLHQLLGGETFSTL